ncbi:hypothetical protein F4823DRAFT_640373 [Ustulina deusta]|nr:hypothetical protein F4823DRAFT_640373 [Ustulina deusta]
MNIVHSFDMYKHVSEFFDILLSRLPNGFLLKLFESDLPTMRAAWEASVPLAFMVDHKGAFSLLMKVGLRHPDWILVHGHRYLSHAVSMGCIDIVRGLLGIGVRADDAFPQDIDEFGFTPSPAILVAAITEDLDCVKELIEGCDVNRIIYCPYQGRPASNFENFVSAVAKGGCLYFHRKSADTVAREQGYIDIGLDKRIYSLVLDIFLDSGADVDLLWKKDRYTAISRLHTRPYSVKWGVKTTRLGICLSAKRGKEFLRAYLDSRPLQHPADRTKLLELILAEQFLLEDRRVIDLEIIQGLVNFGVDINIPHLSLGSLTSSKNSSVLLCRLVLKSHLEGFTKDISTLIALLVGKGAVIDSDVVHAAVAEAGLGVLPELAEHGADIRALGGLALSTAARCNNFEAVSWLLQVGVDLNADIYRMNWKMPRTIIAIACQPVFAYSDIIDEDFVRRGTDFDSANSEMIGYLTRRAAKLRLNSQDPSYFHFLKAFLTANRDGSVLLDGMEFFLDSVAIPEDLATTNETLLELCLAPMCLGPRFIFDTHCYRRLAVYELLLRRGCPVLRESGLALYIYNGGRHEVIYKVLDAGADINACSWANSDDSLRLYPLQAAAMRADLELVKQLLQRGAIINQPPVGARGRTALQGVCEWAPLSIEERTRQMDLIRLLINQGADVNAPAAQHDGMTALQIAALYGDMEVALILLEYGANANAPPANDRGYCALDAAARQGRLDMVKLLLNTAAHSHHRGQSGYEGAIALATKHEHYAVADLIREHIRLFGHCIIVDLDDGESAIICQT